MENDVLDSLDDLGYDGPLREDAVLKKALDEGPTSIEFTKLVEWLTAELAGFTGLDERVIAIAGPEDAETFLMELSGFLREYGCPYSKLCEGPITKRLESKENRLNLLDYLLTELSALRMTAKDRPHLLQTVNVKEPETAAESETAKYLKMMLIALKFPKPPEGITMFQLFSKVEMKIKELLSKIQAAHMSKPLLKARLTEKQWETVDTINTALREEYTCRRDMVLKRLDVTIQSFRWSNRAKGMENDFAAKYQTVRRNLTPNCSVDIPHLLAAREDLLKIEQISGASARERTKCKINKHVIGKVPDRGGRAYEMGPPPPEMPSFQKRQSQPQGQRQQYGGWSKAGQNRRGGGYHGRHQRGRHSAWGDHQAGWGGGGGGGYYAKSKRGRYH